jgi:hypothetical protein
MADDVPMADAAPSGASLSSASSASPCGPRPCQICMLEPRAAVFTACGHVLLCVSCCQEVVRRRQVRARRARCGRRNRHHRRTSKPELHSLAHTRLFRSQPCPVCRVAVLPDGGWRPLAADRAFARAESFQPALIEPRARAAVAAAAAAADSAAAAAAAAAAAEREPPPVTFLPGPAAPPTAVDRATFTVTSTAVELSGHRVGDLGALALAASMPSSSMKRLVLWNNAISDAGFALLAAGLRGQRTLRWLDAGGNGATDTGAAALAAALPWCSITTLSLADNIVSDAGAASLAGALRDSTSLTSLDLSKNAIGVQGASALAGALRASALVSLLLSVNDVGDDGAAAFAAALQGVAAPPALRMLLLSSCGVGARGAAALADVQRASDGRLELFV